ncbi:MAG: DinB family protein [Gammaproteobacteria bacterium]
MELRDAIASLRRTPESLSKQLDGLSDAQLRFNPEGGYFSALENICHLRDIEIEGYGVRLRRLLAEEHPALPDINGGQLAGERRYSEQPVHPALDTFTQARHGNLKILGSVTGTQLARTGFLESTDEITLGGLLELWVEHDRGHIQELEKLRTAIRELHVPQKTTPSLPLGRP